MWTNFVQSFFMSVFNHNNKRLGRDVKYYAEDLELIAKEQHGSRKHHAANDQGLNKELTTDALCQKKTAGRSGFQ
jgi:hypothetical protein